MPAAPLAFRSGLPRTVLVLAVWFSTAAHARPGAFAQGEPARDDPAARDEPAADPLPARLAAARAALAADGVEDPLPQPGPLRITYERATLPAARDSRGQTVRTLAGVLRVQNAGDEPVRLGPGVTLTAGRETRRPDAAPERLNYDGDALGGTAADWQTYRTVEPGEVAELPATFFNLPGDGDRLPDPLLLNVPYVVGGEVAPAADPGGAAAAAGGTPVAASLDVAAYHRGLADLRVDRVGPRGALAVFEVRGELTYPGRFALLDRLRAVSAGGVRRGLLVWKADRPAGGQERGGDAANGGVPPLPPAPVAAGGGTGFDPAARARFGEYASFREGGGAPARVGFAEFARAPARAGGSMSAGGGPALDFGRFFPNPADAAAAVLASALRTLDPLTAERLIRDEEGTAGGGPLVRPGAVRYAGPNLPPAKVPLLVELTADRDPAVRAAAAAALGTFDRPAARDRLVELTRDGDDPALAAAAARALASSRFPGGPAALAATLADGAAGVPASVFAVLAERPDPAWEDTLIELAGDDDADPAVRVAALRAVVGGGHRAADRLLAEAVAGEDPVAARAAFAVLADRPDPAARRLAEEFALRDLRRTAEEGGALNDAVAAFLRTARPPAAAEPLWALFERDAAAPDAGGEGGPGSRATVVGLLAAIAPAARGGAAEEVGERLAAGWATLDGEGRTAVLAAAADLAPGRLPPLAAEALGSGDAELEQAAALALEAAGTDGATVDRLLSEAFAAATDADAAQRLGTRLAFRASPAARAAILEARWDENPARRDAARYFTPRLHAAGPGRAFFSAASDRTEVDADGDGLPDGGPEPHKASLRFLDVALRLDPNLAGGWSQRAFSRGQAGMLEEARTDYLRALALDPYDNMGMTGLAILEIELGGDVDAGLARAEAGFERYPEDDLFAYNLACTYGVAAKAVRKELDSADPAPDAAARYQRYVEKAREHLVRSYRLGMGRGDDREARRHRNHAASDPDLDVLHGDPVFEQIVAGTLPVPVPAEEPAE